LNQLDPILDAATLALFKKMPAWNPGKQRGRAVRQRMSIPIRFDCGAYCP